MSRTPIPLNALRAFEAAARHRSFTRAAEELCVTQAAISHGPMFDSSLIMVQAAMRGAGVALAPYGLFRREIDSGQIVRPFETEIDVDGYWLTRLKSRAPTAAMQAFRAWLLEAVATCGAVEVP